MGAVGRVIVAGSINVDVVARSAVHPAPGQTVAGSHLEWLPGGKGANQAVAAARMGAPTALVGRIGEDVFGDQCLAFLRAEGVDTDLVARAPDRATGAAVIVVADDGENTIVVVPGANGALDADAVARLPIEPRDVVLSQFEIPLETVAAVFDAGRRVGAVTVLNPSPVMPCPPSLLALADIVVLNESEVAAMSGHDVDAGSSRAAVIDAARSMACGADQTVLVTLGPRGAVALVRDEVHVADGRAAAVVDTTGAGDCFTGSMAAHLAAGGTIAEALRWGNAAAGCCVERAGAGPSMPRREEVSRVLAS